MKKRLLFILCLFFVAANSSAGQTRSVTNRDLEKFRQKRVQSEREYRENYGKLGFPSPEELDEQKAESRRKLSELSQQIEAENADNQMSFEERASVLRAQIASVEAQINYLRGELNRQPRQNLFFSSGFYQSYAGGYSSNYPARRGGRYIGGIRSSGYSLSPGFGVGILNGSGNVVGNSNQNLSANGAGFGVSIVGGINNNSYGNYRGGRGRRNGYYNESYGNSGYYGGYVAPYFGGGANRSYERDELVNQIRALEQARAGFYAERSVLEDEARRAGVKID